MFFKLASAGGLVRGEGGTSKASRSPMPSGGVIDRTEDKEDELDMEWARVLRFSGDSVLALLCRLVAAVLVDEGVLAVVCLIDRRFFRAGSSE